MPALPPLAAIRAFEAAARLGNFSRAAEELAMTQAGVSYQIKLLEQRLGVRLFARKGRGIALTAHGARIAPKVSDAFASLGETFASMRSENEAVIAITSSRTFATNWLSARLGAFNLGRPGIAVRLHVSDDVVDLNSSDIDVAIRGVAAPPAGMVCHFLMRQLFAPMASADFLARHAIREPADLLAVARLSPADEWWETWFAALGAVPDSAPGHAGIRFDSQVLDGQAAIAGHGVAILSPVMFSAALQSGQLVQIFPQLASEARSFWLVYPEHKRHSPKVRAFRDWLLATLREDVAPDPMALLVAPEPAG